MSFVVDSHKIKLDYFDYPLPKQLIAQAPLEKRDESRLMVVDRTRSEISLKKFYNILEHIRKDDVLVINDTKVFPARLFGNKNTGGKVELLLLKKLTEQKDGEVEFSSLLKSSKPVRPGQDIFIDDALSCKVVALSGEGKVTIRFQAKRNIYDILDEIGHAPLPPYIKRDNGGMAMFDKNRYQTVYAKNTGAVAAPTAGLHFTDTLMASLKERGVRIVNVTLHVGLGTFMPVRVEDVSKHKMHEERFSLSEESVEEVVKAKANGNRVIAVGTTSLRALESAFDDNAALKMQEGDTSIFIYPGYRFKVVDALITNFHLPKSTLLMLVYAFGGVGLIKRAYKKAVSDSLRFFSYGDAMYIQ